MFSTPPRPFWLNWLHMQQNQPKNCWNFKIIEQKLFSALPRHFWLNTLNVQQNYLKIAEAWKLLARTTFPTPPRLSKHKTTSILQITSKSEGLQSTTDGKGWSSTVPQPSAIEQPVKWIKNRFQSLIWHLFDADAVYKPFRSLSISIVDFPGNQKVFVPQQKIASKYLNKRRTQGKNYDKRNWWTNS